MMATRVAIRPFAPADVSQVYEAVREPGEELAQWMPGLGPDLTEALIADWIQDARKLREEGTAYHFAIVDPVDGVLLGGCGLTQMHLGNGFANLYYWVRSSRRGRGVAAEAAVLLARFGFERIGLNRVEIVVAVGNQPSLRVADKVGAVREGVLRNRLALKGDPHDAVMFSLIPGDFDKAG